MRLPAVSGQRISGKVFLGGNIGSPLISVVDEMTAEDLAVMELSSFQLEIMTCSPQVAAGPQYHAEPPRPAWHDGSLYCCEIPYPGVSIPFRCGCAGAGGSRCMESWLPKFMGGYFPSGLHPLPPARVWADLRSVPSTGMAACMCGMGSPKPS